MSHSTTTAAPALNPPPEPARAEFAVRKKRIRLLGLTLDDAIKVFFGGNALVSVVVLTLITIFLFREGAGFFGQNRQNLTIYRQAGLEYVDLIRRQQEEHTSLTRYLSDVRLKQFLFLTEAKKLSLEDANQALGPFDEFSDRFGEVAAPLNALVSELTETATALKTKFIVVEDKKVERLHLVAAGKSAEAEAVKIETIDFAEELKPVLATRTRHADIDREMAQKLSALVANPPAAVAPEFAARFERLAALTQQYLATFPRVERELGEWDFRRAVPLAEAFTAFVFGPKWETNSSWQDWYGVVPLFVGSLMISLVALALAVPLGVGAAIYINQIATKAEQKFIKPSIEFISAIPSVVLGFFGIAVLGQALRTLSEQSWLSWVPGFPYSERLNILTAGALLGLIAVPTIFTLAEDALNNVPRAFKEASFALGASRLQTIVRIILPASLSGTISAVLLGFGRVIGETMVVLLCAGNRIAIPDFTAGLGVITQPVHTMTGIIAQETGEVSQGSIHWRALFMVGLVLFFLSLVINYVAQKIVRRYRISIG